MKHMSNIYNGTPTACQMPAHMLPLHGGPLSFYRMCELTLGRSNILGLDGVRGVSKVHMTVRSCGDGFEVLDAGSRNGTFVNGERVEGAARVLAARDQITIGRSDARIGFVFELGLPGMQWRVAGLARYPIRR